MLSYSVLHSVISNRDVSTPIPQYCIEIVTFQVPNHDRISTFPFPLQSIPVFPRRNTGFQTWTAYRTPFVAGATVTEL
jgi:hypothetical protein